MTPSVEEVLSGEDGGSATVQLSVSSATLSDDVLVAVQLSDFYDVTNLPDPSPGTWTEIETADLGVDTIHLRAWWRIAGSAGTQTITFSKIDDEDIGAYLYRLRSAGVAPIDDSASNVSETESTSHVALSVSPTSSDALLICAWGTGNGAYDSVPASMTQRGFVDGSPFFELMCADEVLSSSGATGTRTATFDASRPWTAITIAVEGLSGASGTISATTEDATGSLSGTVDNPGVQGTVSGTTEDATASLAGTAEAPTFSGTVSATTEDATASLAGTATGAATGTITAATEDATAAMAGTVVNPAEVDITFTVGTTRVGSFSVDTTRVGSFAVGETITQRGP